MAQRHAGAGLEAGRDDDRHPRSWPAVQHGSPVVLPHRREMEHLFGADLSRVRAWTGRSRELSGLGAVAAASGEDVAFADLTPDRGTVAHEVAHVLQFRHLSVDTCRTLPGKDTAHRGSAESEAFTAAARVSAGLPFQVRQPAMAAVHCLAPGEEPARPDIKETDVPVSAINPANEKHAKRIRSTVADMSRSSELITRNTAHRVLDGDILVNLIEDLTPHPDQAAVLGVSLSPDAVKQALRDGVVYSVPGGNAPKYIPNSANNFFAQEIANTVFIRGLATRAEIQTGLEHEASHALNVDWTTPEQRFDTEARAYYVVELRDSGGNPDPHGRSGDTLRIALAKENALKHYADLGSLYETDASFKQFVDNWKPTGNLVNAPK